MYYSTQQILDRAGEANETTYQNMRLPHFEIADTCHCSSAYITALSPALFQYPGDCSPYLRVLDSDKQPLVQELFYEKLYDDLHDFKKHITIVTPDLDEDLNDPGEANHTNVWNLHHFIMWVNKHKGHKFILYNTYISPSNGNINNVWGFEPSATYDGEYDDDDDDDINW